MHSHPNPSAHENILSIFKCTPSNSVTNQFVYCSVFSFLLGQLEEEEWGKAWQGFIVPSVVKEIEINRRKGKKRRRGGDEKW